MKRFVGSIVLLAAVAGGIFGLAAWKQSSIEAAMAQGANQPEPMETISVAQAQPHDHVRRTTAIGTVLALRSVTLRNELAGTVKTVSLEPGKVVEAGDLLVELDVAVERAELRAQQAQADLAQTLLSRMEKAHAQKAATDTEVDRARAERDVALAQVARIEAIIARKTIVAPFRAVVGLSDVHVGQYLEEGSVLTTLQGVADAVHVEFAVPQWAATRLSPGGRVAVRYTADGEAVEATIVAIDARFDRDTRNAQVRARIDGAAGAPAPGASVRVSVAVGESRPGVVVPVSALRKGPSGDHVFVIEPDAEGTPRAALRPVASGPMLGDDVLILHGLKAGETVAASGSFKLFPGIQVAITPAAGTPAAGTPDPGSSPDGDEARGAAASPDRGAPSADAALPAGSADAVN